MNPKQDPKLPLVAVFFGGKSTEHQISCATAGGVLRAIDRNRWSVAAVGITPEGEWVPLPDDPAAYDLKQGGGYTVTAGERRVALLPGTAQLIEYSKTDGRPGGEIRALGAVDVAFPLLHGPFGEDGTIQGLFEMSGVRYVGCGVAASAICQDKSLTKTVLHAAGIDVGSWVSFTKSQWSSDRERVEAEIGGLGLPLFVKPSRGGSSIGVSRVDHWRDLDAAVALALDLDAHVIVESATPGREVECGVLTLTDGTIATSAVGEIVVQGADLYDYETKYFNPDSVALTCPAGIEFDVADRIRATAAKAFAAVGGEGISRVDFFYDQATDALVLNEINTLPGFTPFSMYPTMFREAGLAYVELVAALLDEAAQRPLGLR